MNLDLDDKNFFTVEKKLCNDILNELGESYDERSTITLDTDFLKHIIKCYIHFIEDLERKGVPACRQN